MTDRPVFWMPAPHQMRAGAVWITAQSWYLAGKRRFGDAVLLTPRGPLDEQAIAAATRHHGSSRSGPSPTRARVVSETLLKDARWLARDLKVRLKPPPASRPHFVWQHHDLFQTGGGRLARSFGVPLVTFVDAPYVWESARWGTSRPGWGPVVEWAGESRELRRADLVCCVSEEVAEKVGSMGVPPSRLAITPCTAEVSQHAGARSRREEHGLEGRIVVGWLGSFRSFHHLDMLADAAVRSGTSGPPLSVLLVGDGADRDRTVDYARSLGLHVVAPGAVDHDEVPDWLATMDIAVILAARGQSFHYSPLKLKEYMAAGRAIVAPAVGEMGRVLRDGVDACLYGPGNVGELADAIQRLASDGDLRARVGAGAVDTVVARFSIDTQLDEVLQRLGL
ncbi:MAG: glycosyltransferase family 4 protein [Alphaproteobacteria bacterium]|nr:glycosyltransferase family 4 protein [Alphaproteobacteria bacterium]